MAYTQDLPVRFQDVDFARVVFYPKLFDYCHRVFEDFFAREVGIPYAQMLSVHKVGFPTVHAEADFSAPLRFGDTCHVVMGMKAMSQRSITCGYRFYRGASGVLCTTLTIVTAAVNMDTFTATEVPEGVRQAMGRHPYS